MALLWAMVTSRFQLHMTLSVAGSTQEFVDHVARLSPQVSSYQSWYDAKVVRGQS